MGPIHYIQFLLLLAMTATSLHIVKCFRIERSKTVSTKKHQPQLILLVAANTNNVDGAKWALKNGAKINFKAWKFGGVAPLQVAALKDSIEVAQLLLDNGAMVEMADRNGRTALHLAAKRRAVLPFLSA